MPKVVEQHSIDSPEINKRIVQDFHYNPPQSDFQHPIFKQYKKGEPRDVNIFDNYVKKALNVGNNYILQYKDYDKIYPEIIKQHVLYRNKLLTPELNKIIQDYTGSSIGINDFLRGNKGNLFVPKSERLRYPPEHLEDIEQAYKLHNLINKMPMFKNKYRFLTYRGLDVKDNQLWDWVKRITQLKEKGYGFRLPEILSTSLNPNDALGFTNFNSRSPTILEVVTNHGMLIPGPEHEFLLPNRSKFRLLETLPNKLVNLHPGAYPSKVGNIIRLLQV